MSETHMMYILLYNFQSLWLFYDFELLLLLQIIDLVVVFNAATLK